MAPAHGNGNWKPLVRLSHTGTDGRVARAIPRMSGPLRVTIVGFSQRFPASTVLSVTLLAGLVWGAGCGDGATEPPPPPPDPPRPTTVAVSPATASLTALGATVQLSAQVRDQNGQAMAGTTVTWASSATAVATVSAAGLVAAAGNGEVTITATAGGVSDAATVNVKQEVSAVAISPAADTMVVGDTARLATEATDANGHAVQEAEVEWASSNPGVAAVDSTGLVSAVGAGEVEITATMAGVTGRSGLTVLAPLPTTVTLTPDTLAFTALGQSAELAAEVRDQAGRVMTEAAVSWSSADTTVTTVDSAGLVMAVGSGETTVTATAVEASGEAVVKVMQSAGSVVVSPPTDTVALGDTLRLVAEAYDENGHRVDGAVFSWSSSDVSVARVDGSGLVTAVAEGRTTITATAGDARGTARITVENPDRAALVALYNATDGPNWVNNENWLTDAPLGEWYGVDTDVSGHVVRLNLGGQWDREAREYIRHGLSGPIPPELGNLANLTWLALNNNALEGSIPAELGELTNLRTLALGTNELTGPIPTELLRLANIERLSLGNNELTGPIPSELGSLTNLESLYLQGNELTGPIPTELGRLANIERLSLGRNSLTGPIPPELGQLASLESLYLSHNQLTGPIPPELGQLSSLESLYLSHNNLSGPVSQSLLHLDRLRYFFIASNESLCVPGISAFFAWLRGIEERDAESEVLCNATDMAALQSLFEATGGTDWIESDGWLGNVAVEEWHGVSADSLGHVTALVLSRNGLTGRLPNNLGNLAEMTRLRIGDNALSGRLPSTLSRLSLIELHYADTQLCAPTDASFQTWLAGIPSHEGTGEECAPLSDREILEILYDATGGPDWTSNDNWLTDAPLGDWYGVSVDGEGRVRGLILHANALAGSVPPELGNLTRLRTLSLSSTADPNVRSRKVGNGLVGPIPPELGNLSELRSLVLRGNNLTGPIPPELGNLSELEGLSLDNNKLTGPIPAELGNLSELQWLHLYSNKLTGSIPSELGGLSDVTRLDFSNNDFSTSIPAELGGLTNLTTLLLRNARLLGPIPPELGDLAKLDTLDLGSNGLTGWIPPELGALPRLLQLVLSKNELSGPVPDALADLETLEGLELTNNTGMSGALPSSLTALSRLKALLAEGTDLCSPTDTSFLSWLEGVHKRRIAACTDMGVSQAYLTQSVQSREFPVPLVANRRALVRVFPTARETTAEGIPAIRATFYLNDTAVHAVDIPAKSAAIPTEVREGSLATSSNAEIPASIVQPGLEMAVEVDPDGTLDAALGVTKRIPETGRMAIDVRTMPTLDMTLVPFLWSVKPDSSVLDIVESLSPEDELFWMTRTLLPVGDFDLAVHEPVLTSSNNTFTIARENKAIWVMEGRRGHYVAVLTGESVGPRGGGFLDSRVMFLALGRSNINDWRYVMAHELGHTMSLLHTPCGGANNQDASYPYTNGSIGVWGYDFRDGGSLVAPHNRDLMSYCGSGAWWISDYHFTNALRYRLVDEGVPTASVATSAKSLLVWGGVDEKGDPYLDPAFIVDAPPALPDSAGEYRLTGETSHGRQLFSLSFTMSEVADGDGRASFVFVLPAQPSWADSLAAVTLSGPGGSFTLDGESDLSMAILRDPRNGQVRGILRDVPGAAQAAADTTAQADGPEFELLFSRGIPDASAWRR